MVLKILDILRHCHLEKLHLNINSYRFEMLVQYHLIVLILFQHHLSKQAHLAIKEKIDEVSPQSAKILFEEMYHFSIQFFPPFEVVKNVLYEII